MRHPIPPGTRDVLPEEMRELRALEDALRATFERFGYGEVSTPTIEYDEVLAKGDVRGAPSAHRFFDSEGELLALRSDMTVPIARLVASRYGDAQPPHRLCYLGSSYRDVRPQRGQMREFRQAGVELVGVEAPDGTAEVVEVLAAALEAAGLSRAVIGLGDANLYLQLLEDLAVEPVPRDAILDRLANHDLVGLEAEVDGARLEPAQREILVEISRLRGGPDVLDKAVELGGEAVERASAGLRTTYEAIVARGVSERVQLDLGLLRDLGYYTGGIVEVYDPALGHVLGGGGRYDALMGRFGRDLPAAGFALYLERLHIAEAQEERISRRTPLADERPIRGGSKR